MSYEFIVKMVNLSYFDKLRRSEIWITPCKQSAARGEHSTHPELRRSSTHYGVVIFVVIRYPELLFPFDYTQGKAYSGLSIFTSFGGKDEIKNIKKNAEYL